METTTSRLYATGLTGCLGGGGGAAAACAACGSSRLSTSPHAHRHFVLWGEPPAEGAAFGFLCPEPWLSGPDSLNTLQGTPLLLPGESATWTFCVEVAFL